MQVIFHAGVHATDDDRVLKCLLKNREDFAKRGTAVPPPGRYRKLLHRTLLALQEARPSPDAREILLEAILEGDPAERLLLSNENLFCVPSRALVGGTFYHFAQDRVENLQRLFSGDQLELFFAIRNPATFLPALFSRTNHDEFIEFTRGHDPRSLTWFELIARLRAACPDVPITVWCNEDTPLIWAQIIREIAGLEPMTKIKGGFDLLSEIMSREGMKRFRAYLKEHPVMTEMQKRRVMAAFLDKFAKDEMIEEVIDLPGWTEDFIEEMTDNYDEEVFEIARIPGVNFISP